LELIQDKQTSKGKQKESEAMVKELERLEKRHKEILEIAQEGTDVSQEIALLKIVLRIQEMKRELLMGRNK